MTKRHITASPAAVWITVSTSSKSLPTIGCTSVCGTWHWVQKKRRGVTAASTWPSRFWKWVTETIGAWLTATAVRLWQVRHLLTLRSIW